MGPRAVLLASAAICAGIALPAHAATRTPVEVAHVGGARLLAGEEKGKLCISVAPVDFDTTCADPRDDVATLSLEGIDGPLLVGAVVPAAAATVEVRRAGVLLGTGSTVAGDAYKGVRAGSVRFALIRLTKAKKTDGLRVRALNAAGALVEVLAPNDSEELVVARTRLLSGRARGLTWKIVAERRSELTPSILDLAHETTSLCVVTILNDLGRGTVCESGVPLESLSFLDAAQAAGADTCNPPFRLLHGVVAGSVTAVSVLLGDGRRRTVPTVPVGDGRRTYAVATGPGAVRSVTLPGRVVPTALAPISAVCAEGGQGLQLFNVGSSALGSSALGLLALFNLPPVTPVGPVTAIAGSPGMQVADGPADTLCIAVAGKPLDGLGCSIVGPRDPHATYDTLLDPHAFAIAVPANAASVRFGTADGRVVRSVPTDAGAGYRGRYAGAVRFASGSIASFLELARFELLDAAGTVIYTDDTSSEDDIAMPRVGTARRVAGRADRPSLWQTIAHYGNAVDRCLSLTDGPPPTALDDCQTSRYNRTVLLDASCVTKRLSVAIAVRSGIRVVADTGSRYRRAVRLRRGLAVLTLPPGRGLRSLTFIRNGRRDHVEMGAPPGAKQCGWHLAPSVEEL
jgi:hypothetical protein